MTETDAQSPPDDRSPDDEFKVADSYTSGSHTDVGNKTTESIDVVNRIVYIQFENEQNNRNEEPNVMRNETPVDSDVDTSTKSTPKWKVSMTIENLSKRTSILNETNNKQNSHTNVVTITWCEDTIQEIKSKPSSNDGTSASNQIEVISQCEKISLVPLHNGNAVRDTSQPSDGNLWEPLAADDEIYVYPDHYVFPDHYMTTAVSVTISIVSELPLFSASHFFSRLINFIFTIYRLHQGNQQRNWCA